MANASSYSKSDFDDKAHGLAQNVADKASDYAAKASHQVDKALDTAESVARGLADQGRDAGERVSQVAGHMRTAVDKSVKDQPMATLAVAAVFGFVLGALWKS